MSTLTYTNYTNIDASFCRPYEPGDRLVKGWSEAFPACFRARHRLASTIVVEVIFAKHNRDDRPDGRLCPSMSVGDVIVIGEIALSVASIGFVRVAVDPADLITDRTWSGGGAMSKIDVDHRGLQRIVRERGEVTLLDELVQNALDTDATEITVEISSPANNRVRVDRHRQRPDRRTSTSSHAYTLFAPSVKRDDASKRGFMNVGDKLAVAYAVAGEITSTSGSRDHRGRRASSSGRKRREVGTIVDLTFPMSQGR